MENDGLWETYPYSYMYIHMMQSRHCKLDREYALNRQLEREIQMEKHKMYSYFMLLY